MKITGIEEQVAVKTAKEVAKEVEDLFRPIYTFLERNVVLNDSSPFQVRGEGGQFRSIDHSVQLYYNLKSYFAELILKKRTQKAVDDIVKKLTEMP